MWSILIKAYKWWSILCISPNGCSVGTVWGASPNRFNNHNLLLQSGTDDFRTLSAIYSQLGNAYFYLGDYVKAMQVRAESWKYVSPTSVLGIISFLSTTSTTSHWQEQWGTGWARQRHPGISGTLSRSVLVPGLSIMVFWITSLRELRHLKATPTD